MLDIEQYFAKLYFASHFVTWPTRERPAKLFALMILNSVFLISLHILYKPTLPTKL